MIATKTRLAPIHERLKRAGTTQCSGTFTGQMMIIEPFVRERWTKLSLMLLVPAVLEHGAEGQMQNGV